jgi:hypothetical protein
MLGDVTVSCVTASDVTIRQKYVSSSHDNRRLLRTQQQLMKLKKSALSLQQEGTDSNDGNKLGAKTSGVPKRVFLPFFFFLHVFLLSSSLWSFIFYLFLFVCFVILFSLFRSVFLFNKFVSTAE